MNREDDRRRDRAPNELPAGYWSTMTLLLVVAALALIVRACAS